MEIGLFQLENLMHANARFCFLDLRDKSMEVPPALAAILARAEKISPAQVEIYLKEKAKDAPVILLSEDGRAAGTLAAKLESAGYANIYVVEGGVAGLLTEL